MTISREAFRKKLKAVCSNCSESTVTTYLHNIFRLYRLLDETAESLPSTSSWLKQKKLLKKHDSQKLSARRVLSLAGIKAQQAYNGKDSKIEEWYIRMKKTVEEYETKRDKRQKTAREQERWPKQGYDALKTAADKLKKEMKPSIDNTKSLSDLYKVQRYVVLKLYSEHALRLDWADVKLAKPSKDRTEKWNYLNKDRRKGWILTLRKYKTEKFMGQQELKIAKPAALALTMFVPKVKNLTNHGFLLSTKAGNKLSRTGLSLFLSRLTEKYMGKRLSAQIIRVLKATKYRAQTEKSAEIAKEMLHGDRQHLQYSKKE